jgi:hypothetical protein
LKNAGVLNWRIIKLTQDFSFMLRIFQTKRMIGVIILSLFFWTGITLRSATIFIEAESFQDYGGWKLDTQFIEIMGSPYLIAHGLGKPVSDATTTVNFPKAGTYRVYVRTKDWVARWNAPGTPGKFQLLINGQTLDEVFGTKGADWFWQDGGSVRIQGPNHYDPRVFCIFW